MKQYILLALLLLGTVAYGAALKSPTAKTPKSPKRSQQQFNFQTKTISVQSKDDVIRDLKDQNKTLQAQVDRGTKQTAQLLVTVRRLETDLRFAQNTIRNLRNQIANSQRPVIAPTSPRNKTLVPQPPSISKPTQQRPINPRLKRVQQQTMQSKTLSE